MEEQEIIAVSSVPRTSIRAFTGTAVFNLFIKIFSLNDRYFYCAPVFQVARLRLREVKELAQGNMTVKQGAWNLNTGGLISWGQAEHVGISCDLKAVWVGTVALFSVMAFLATPSGTCQGENWSLRLTIIYQRDLKVLAGQKLDEGWKD